MENRIDEMNKTDDRRQVEFYFWIHSAFRKYIEIAMDLILLGLVLVVFVFTIETIYLLGKMVIYHETDVRHIVSEVLFIFILLEILRILIIYIEFHHISVDIMVELAIVVVLKELILYGIVEIGAIKIAGISLLLVVLGLLLKFGGIRKKVGDDTAAYEPFFKAKKQEKKE
jgi:uncharacterized membrane protein (DUF373 family)